jgi:hypothetical protein
LRAIPNSSKSVKRRRSDDGNTKRHETMGNETKRVKKQRQRRIVSRRRTNDEGTGPRSDQCGVPLAVRAPCLLLQQRLRRGVKCGG